MKNLHKIFVIVFVFAALKSTGQNSIQLYNMQEVPQSSRLNPAIAPEGKFYIGIPVMSSLYFNFGHSGFAYSDLIRRRQDDSLYIDTDNLVNTLNENNYLQLNIETDLLSTGFRVNRNYFSLNISEKVHFKTTYSKDLMRFLLKGNAQFLGTTAELGGNQFELLHYREYGIGYSRTIGEHLSIGTRLKYLYGMEAVSSEKTVINIFTDESTYDIRAEADLLVNTSGVKSMANGDFNASNYLSGSSNTGFAADLGVNYQAGKVSVAASVLDIGRINWKGQATNYALHNASFEFTGIDFTEFINAEEDSVDYIGEMLDSLEQSFDITEQSNSFTTKLAPKIFAGVTYAFNENNLLSLTGYGEIYDDQLQPNAGVSFQKKFGKVFRASVSYAWKSRSTNNLGAGFFANMGPVQWYMMSDNILGAFKPQHAQTLHFHTGFNLIFGKKQKPKEKRNLEVLDTDNDGIADEHDDCPEVYGNAWYRGCPDSDKDGIRDIDDQCPDVAGERQYNGCKEPQKQD